MPKEQYIHLDILHRKKKCMFGKDDEPAQEPHFFSGWVTADSGTTWTTATEDTGNWTHAVRIEYD